LEEQFDWPAGGANFAAEQSEFRLRPPAGQPLRLPTVSSGRPRSPSLYLSLSLHFSPVRPPVKPNLKHKLQPLPLAERRK